MLPKNTRVNPLLCSISARGSFTRVTQNKDQRFYVPSEGRINSLWLKDTCVTTWTRTKLYWSNTPDFGALNRSATTLPKSIVLFVSFRFWLYAYQWPTRYCNCCTGKRCLPTGWPSADLMPKWIQSQWIYRTDLHIGFDMVGRSNYVHCRRYSYKTKTKYCNTDNLCHYKSNEKWNSKRVSLGWNNIQILSLKTVGAFD